MLRDHGGHGFFREGRDAQFLPPISEPITELAGVGGDQSLEQSIGDNGDAIGGGTIVKEPPSGVHIPRHNVKRFEGFSSRPKHVFPGVVETFDDVDKEEKVHQIVEVNPLVYRVRERFVARMNGPLPQGH